MDEMPEDEVGAEDEVTGEFALKAQVDVLRGPTWHVRGKQYTGYLFGDLDRPERGIGLGQITGQAGPAGSTSFGLP
jgi:hypothetical protein